ncbi:hypothetical protein [Pseudodesulfovibrio portus]|uniref:Uncharacterized protein n=1 Tax=Pseudodesulfovibrio portus TaxID=231439 RepID=A0ABN6RVL2_9BACT|nr:hypothetical protein [Pseudodesulfovibrio portus]BDQ33411.1 hypothetical protein JCM14722_09530 [Pseudodesulfovibrio portus]
MISECNQLHRADVRLDPEKLHGFTTACVAHGNCFADVFWDTRIYLERDGRITLEFLPHGGTLHFVMFELDEWSPAVTASADAMRLFTRFRKEPDDAQVFDIFTGERLQEDQLEARRHGFMHPAHGWDERLAF